MSGPNPPERIALVAHGGRLGHERALLTAAAKRELGPRLLSVEFTGRAGEATDLARAALAAGADALVAAGGDGTVFEVLQALKGTGVPLGVVPGGSGNDFAFHLGVKGDAGPVLRRLAEARVQPADRLEVNGRVIATAVCWGVAAGVGEDATKLRDKVPHWGKLPKLVKGGVYQVTAVARLLRDVDDTFTLTGELDGEPVRYRAWSAAVGDARRIGGAFLAFPDASKRDGKAHLLVAEKGPWKERMWTAALLRPGLHGARPGVHTRTFRKAVLTASPAQPWLADGETLPATDRFAVELIPDGQPLLVPTIV